MDKLEYIPGDLVMTNGVPCGTANDIVYRVTIINDANDEICSCMNDYIESLPYKAGDKVSCSRCDVCWITSIVPQKGYSGYTGEIDVRINPAKKDGTRSNREFVLLNMEIDNIKKID